jgi:hypothetical protein
MTTMHLATLTQPFGLPLGGKIEDHAVYPQRPPAGIGRTSTVFGDPPGRAVRVDHAVLEREGVPSAKCLADYAAHVIEIGRTNDRLEGS